MDAEPAAGVLTLGKWVQHELDSEHYAGPKPFIPQLSAAVYTINELFCARVRPIADGYSSQLQGPEYEEPETRETNA